VGVNSVPGIGVAEVATGWVTAVEVPVDVVVVAAAVVVDVEVV
jgi:hypothetical protein